MGVVLLTAAAKSHLGAILLGHILVIALVIRLSIDKGVNIRLFLHELSAGSMDIVYVHGEVHAIGGYLLMRRVGIRLSGGTYFPWISIPSVDVAGP